MPRGLTSLWWADRRAAGGWVDGWAGCWMMDDRVYPGTVEAIDTLSGGAGES